jgi:hypothetical protein
MNIAESGKGLESRRLAFVKRWNEIHPNSTEHACGKEGQRECKTRNV